jgi:hypothetical protein
MDKLRKSAVVKSIYYTNQDNIMLRVGKLAEEKFYLSV